MKPSMLYGETRIGELKRLYTQMIDTTMDGPDRILSGALLTFRLLSISGVAYILAMFVILLI